MTDTHRVYLSDSSPATVQDLIDKLSELPAEVRALPVYADGGSASAFVVRRGTGREDPDHVDIGDGI